MTFFDFGVDSICSLSLVHLTTLDDVDDGMTHDRIDDSMARDPLAVFDDYALLEIFAHLDFHDVLVTAYNVSRRWRAWCQRTKVCKKRLEKSEYAVGVAEMIQRGINDGYDVHVDDFVEWRALCRFNMRTLLTTGMEKYQHDLGWKRGDVTVQWSPELLRSKASTHYHLSDVDPFEGTILRLDENRLDIIDDKSLAPIHSGIKLWSACWSYRIVCLDVVGNVLCGLQKTPNDTLLVHVWLTHRARALFPAEVGTEAAPRPPDNYGFQYLASFTLDEGFMLFDRSWALTVDEVSPGVYALVVVVDDQELNGVGSMWLSRLATTKAPEAIDGADPTPVPPHLPGAVIPTYDDGMMPDVDDEETGLQVGSIMPSRIQRTKPTGAVDRF